MQRVVFRNNLVRHTAGGVNILGTDNLNAEPAHQHDHRERQRLRRSDGRDLGFRLDGRSCIGDGPDNVTIDHNTIFSTNPQFIWLYGGTATAPSAATNSRVTNNMAAHNTYGIMASELAFGNDDHQQLSAGRQQRHRQRHRRRQRLEVSGGQLVSDAHRVEGELSRTSPPATIT